MLVTTKKGTKDDKVKVNLNGYYGWQNLTRFPELASAPQYVRGLLESEQNAGKDPSSLYSKEEYAKWQNYYFLSCFTISINLSNRYEASCGPGPASG